MIIELIWRTVVIYTILLVVMRIMGKREVGQLSPSDLVVAIVIAELAAIPMENTEVSLLLGIVPILTLMVAEIFLSWASLKSLTVRKIISGTPSIVIEEGKIVEKELRSQRYNIHDMLSQLRDKGVFNIADVEYAILESSGRLSVYLKAEKRPVIPLDLEIKPGYEGLPIPLIVDGKPITTNLEKIGKDQVWLLENIQSRGFQSMDRVLFASLDHLGRFYISPKD